MQSQPEQLMPNYDLGEKLNCKGAIINGINTIALMLRMELYVDEHRWKSVNKETQVNLNTVIQCCEEQVSQILFNWNKHRSNVSSNEPLKDDSLYKITLSKTDLSIEKRKQSKWQNSEIKY